MARYIGYFYEYDGDERVDDFKEWCDANSEEEAWEEFEDRYSHTNRIRIEGISKA